MATWPCTSRFDPSATHSAFGKPPDRFASDSTYKTDPPLLPRMANKELEGTKAPNFKATDQDGKTWTLKDFAGSNLVLYFYPKDDTPGCTTEACAFRDNLPKFEGVNAKIVGVSPDDVASHIKFAEKYELPFTLLADPDHKICEDYDVWKEKNMYGKRFFGVVRSTFVIDGKGIIRKVWGKVKVDGHDQEVLEAVQGLEQVA